MIEAVAALKYLYYRGERPLYLLSEQSEKDGVQVIELASDQVEDLCQGTLGQFVVREGKLYRRSQLPHALKRVAMITDWGTNCGIATYAGYLADGLRPLVSDLRIFAEEAAGKNDEPGVVRCWSRSGDYSRILPAIRDFDPDLILIQHEYGLFHQQQLWSALLSQLSRWRTVTILHTVLEHDVPHREARQDYLTRCLTEAACREVIVHTPRARLTMRDRGYSGRVHFVPHGCFAPDLDNKLPSTKYGLYPEHTIFQYGFGGRHKGWNIAIDIVEKLKEKYPKVFYLGSMNVSDFDRGDVDAYHADLLDQVLARGIENNVSILKGYQSEQMIGQLFRCSRVALFPYQVPNPHWASWGASGAIQQALSLGMPTVLSDFPAFQEFQGHLPICRSVSDYVQVIDRIFSDPAYEKLLRAQSHGISELRRWDRTAQWFLECGADSDYNSPGYPEEKRL